MSESPHLGIGYLAPSQAQKHVTVNEAFRRLDALVQLGVLDRDRTTPPASPDEGDRHIVGAGATGAWAGEDGHVAAWLDGAWTDIEPRPGWLAYDAGAGEIVVRLPGGWVNALGSLASLDALERLGVSTTADMTNRLAVASEAALFTHQGAGVQVKLNKAALGDTASLLYQTAYSGRAECGLAGSDAFSIKVSADGSSWLTALTADPATGSVELPCTPSVQIDKFVASGTWSRPSWARRVYVIMASGGGGGGSGALRGAGVAVSGGGGGAPGGMAEVDFLASDLTSTVAVTVGAGGAGGAAQTSASADGAAGALGGVSSFGSYARSRIASVASGGGTASSGATSVLRGFYNFPTTMDITSGAGATGAGAVGTAGAGKISGGGGGGGGLSAANAWSAGGAAGISGWLNATTQGALAGATEGAAGAAGAVFPRTEYLSSGGSGGGGAAGASVNGGAGGDGAAPGGAGGGGGAGRNGLASGKGGNGARGEVWVISVA